MADAGTPPKSYPPIPGATGRSRRLRERPPKAGLPRPASLRRNQGWSFARPEDRHADGGLSPWLLFKSAGWLAKIRKRSQLGEVLPIRHLAPFPLLSSVGPRSTAAPTRPFGPSTTHHRPRRGCYLTQNSYEQNARRLRPCQSFRVCRKCRLSFLPPTF